MVAAPRIISWNLTRACNLACAHCYLDAEQRQSGGPDELQTDAAVDIVGQISALAPGAMLVLTGGEPLLRGDLDVIVTAAAKAGLMPVIGTNGLRLTDARADALRAAGAVGVGISLDSVDPPFHDRLRGAPGAHARALAGIQAAKRAGLAVQLQTTLFAETVDGIEDMAALAEAQGAMALHFFFLVCTGRGVTQTDMPGALYEAALQRILAAQEHHPRLMVRARCAPYMRRLLRLKQGESGGGYTEVSSACLAGRSYLRITPEGVVTPCPYIPEAVGDLKCAPLGDIWQGSPVFHRLRHELPSGKCGTCDFRLSCGGCRARALATTGDLMGEDGKCGYVRSAMSAPEPLPGSAPRESAIAWAPEAEAMLARIPGFVRETVRRKVEQAASREGLASITLDYMRARRPASLPFSHPARHGQ
jgi:radical SAM protein with 4Fe4S-binding SPASM domain